MKGVKRGITGFIKGWKGVKGAKGKGTGQGKGGETWVKGEWGKFLRGEKCLSDGKFLKGKYF